MGRYPGPDHGISTGERHRAVALAALRMRARKDDELKAQLRAIDEAIEAGIRMLPRSEQPELLEALREEQAAHANE